MSSLLSRQSPVGPAPTPEQTKVLAVVALRPVGVLLAVCATLVIVTLVSANSDLTGTMGAIAAVWLVVHHVPLGIGGADLGVLPLLPTLVLIASVARGCATAVRAVSGRDEPARRDVVRIGAAALAGPLAFAAVMLAVIGDASSVILLSTPNALATFGWVAVTHGIGIAVGLVIGTWPAALQRCHVPAWAAAAAVPTARAAMALLAGGAVMTAASLAMSWLTLGTLLDSGDGILGALGLTALSVLYLPNVIVGGAAVLAGSTAHVGTATVGLFDTTVGPLPAVPVLAALPESSAQVWWPVLLVVPVLAAVLLGRGCAASTLSVGDAVRAALIGAVAVSVSSVIVGFAAGGVFGTFGHVGVDVPLLGAATFAWCAVIGGAAAATRSVMLGRHRRTEWAADSDDEDSGEQDSGEQDSDDQDSDEQDRVEQSMADDPAGEMLALEGADDPAQPSDTVAEDGVPGDADVVDAEIVEIDEPGGDSPRS